MDEPKWPKNAIHSLGDRTSTINLFFAVLVSSLACSNCKDQQTIPSKNRHSNDSPASNIVPSTADTSMPSCGVYLAPSTIPGAGLGIFAGIDHQKGDLVTHGDLVVPLVDMDWHVPHDSFLWDDYTWSSTTFPGMEHDGKTVSGASFGIGALPNCNFAALNVEDGETFIDSAGLHRSKDPGAGAFTPYHGRTSSALREIQAGEEIFVSYGESYFTSRQSTLGYVPLENDFVTVDNLFSHYMFLRHQINYTSGIDMITQNKTCASPLSSLDEDIDLIDQLQSWHHDLLSLVSSISSSFPLSPLKLISSDPIQADKIAVEHGGSFQRAQVHASRRNVAWLEEHGTCADNLRPGLSNIPQAGRGAFAARSLSKGSVVAPLPVIQIPDRHVLTMYAMKEHSDRFGTSYNTPRNTSAPIHNQLLLNYCFGHANTTLLLCPYGIITSLINHDGVDPNVEMRWSTKHSRNLNWLEQPIEQWQDETTAGLAFELIALRDIKPNEEILLDYGSEWQTAWEKHVESWKPPSRSSKYIAASELEKEPVIRTEADNKYYDSNTVALLCRYTFLSLHGVEVDYVRKNEDDEEEETEEKYTHCRALEKYDNPSPSSDDDKYLYTVEVYAQASHRRNKVCHQQPVAILWNVSRDIFTFEDVLYTRDHSQDWSFRHDIRIPDSLIPKVWMNTVN